MRASLVTLAALLALSSPILAAPSAQALAKREHRAPASFLAGPGPVVDDSADNKVDEDTENDGRRQTGGGTKFWRGAGARRAFADEGGTRTRVGNYDESTIFEESTYALERRSAKQNGDRKLVDLKADVKVGNLVGVDAEATLRGLAQKKAHGNKRPHSKGKKPSKPHKTNKKGGKKPKHHSSPKKSSKPHSNEKPHTQDNALVDVDAKVKVNPLLSASAGVHLLNKGGKKLVGRTHGVKHLVDVVAEVDVRKVLDADVMAKVLRKRTDEVHHLVDAIVEAKVDHLIDAVVKAKVL